jgi:chaperonin GroEL (HSP60 family)
VVRLSAEERGYKLENADLSYLGKAEKITIDKDNTTVINGKGKKEDIRAAYQPDQISNRKHNF